MKQAIKQLLLLVFTLLIFQSNVAVVFAQERLSDGKLASWVGGSESVKQKIIDFVEQVSDKNSKHFVPESARIATFDMDGTLICEKPNAFAEVLAINFLQAIANESPTLSQVQPYKAALKNDDDYLDKNFLQVLTVAYMGYPQSEYRKDVLKFINTEKHPRFDMPYGDLIYQPMVELLEYLKLKNFDVYIVSGSWQGFVRVVGKEKLGFEYSHLIGSKIELDFQVRDGNTVFLRAGDSLEPANVEDGKPENIQAHIGMKPILAFGNSSGDQQMYEYAGSNHYSHLSLSLEHDDAEREYQYPSTVNYRKGWLKVSIKDDFKVVFKDRKFNDVFQLIEQKSAQFIE